MKYKLDECSCYKSYTIGSVPIYIFNSHNMALPVWGTYAVQYGALNLLSFDTHTDTHFAFSTLLSENGMQVDCDYEAVLNNPIVAEYLSGVRYRIEDFSFEDVFKYSMEIPNTEQILNGVAFGYLKSYTIRHHLSAVNYERDDQLNGYDAIYIDDDDERKPIIRQPLALDIDLDYFRSRDEFGNDFKHYISPFLKNSCVVTIAREQRYFDDGKIESDLSVDEAEKRLLDIIKDILS